jgi:hypothetical protein
VASFEVTLAELVDRPKILAVKSPLDRATSLAALALHR